MATFAWGEATVSYTLVDRPIPQSQLDGPCATAWYWPEAQSVLQGHDAHLLVTLVDEARNALEKAMRLTKFTVAVCSASGAVGILWGPAGLIHEPRAFAEQARQMSPDNLPLYLWIDFRIEPTATGHRLFTTGLESFDRKELELFTPSEDLQQLLDDAYNVAHYHLDQESPIKDGDTVGLPDGRQLVARHDASATGDDRRVIRLEYE